MNLIEKIQVVRGKIVRFFIPKNIRPLSSKFGYDRGTPIDRYWIENFMNENKSYIKGSVLEITDPTYTFKYGLDITKSDVLDINTKNKKANIYGDLRNLKGVIKDSVYDCIILTHVLGLIDDYGQAVKEIRRILKPGGVVLYTGSCLGPILGEEVFWRFNQNSVKYIFKKYFNPRKIKIKSYGNNLSGQAFWVGMSQEDLEEDVLNYNDSRFPCVVTAVVVK